MPYNKCRCCCPSKRRRLILPHPAPWGWVGLGDSLLMHTVWKGINNNATVWNLANTTLTKRWRLTSPPDATQMSCTPDTMQQEGWFISVVFPKFYDPRLILKEMSDWLKLRDMLQIAWAVLLKIAKAMENKEGLRNCHTPEDTKETWQLNLESII